jgi:hypothetical protein
VAVLGYDHIQVGARLLKAWNFPPMLVVVAEHYLKPLTAPTEALPLIANLHAAKFVATSLGAGVGEDGFLFELNESFLLEWGFTAAVLQEIMPIVHDRATARLKGKMTQGAISM